MAARRSRLVLQVLSVLEHLFRFWGREKSGALFPLFLPCIGKAPGKRRHPHLIHNLQNLSPLRQFRIGVWFREVPGPGGQLNPIVGFTRLTLSGFYSGTLL